MIAYFCRPITKDKNYGRDSSFWRRIDAIVYAIHLAMAYADIH